MQFSFPLFVRSGMLIRVLSRMLSLFFILGVDIGGGKLAGWHSSVIENVELSVRSVFGLWHKEEGKDEDGDTCAEPDEAGSALEIPCSWVKSCGKKSVSRLEPFV